jgi:hypothetical protein
MTIERLSAGGTLGSVEPSQVPRRERHRRQPARTEDRAQVEPVGPRVIPHLPSSGTAHNEPCALSATEVLETDRAGNQRVVPQQSLDALRVFKVTTRGRRRLWRATEAMAQVVVDAGGRFYPAKDSTLAPEPYAAALGPERLARFRTLKNRWDPEHLLQTNLSRRLLGVP